MPDHGDLTGWAEQGVLLLNTVLSVEQDKPKSHDRFGWQTLTAALVAALSASRSGLVFMLWGNSAKSLQEHIVPNGHTIIASSHPSPIGGSCNKGFFGSRPFSRANAALRSQGQAAIDWAL
jgi:uracil-DNA glycosylase